MDTYNKLCSLRPKHLEQKLQPLLLTTSTGIYNTYNEKILKYNSSLQCYKQKKEAVQGGHNQKIIVL